MIKDEIFNNNDLLKKTYWLYLLFFIIILIGYFFLRLNLIHIPLNRDEGGFAYFGRFFSDGGILYQDFYDNKPPGVWFIYAGLYYVAPFTPAGIHWSLHIYNLITLLVLGILAYKLFNVSSALWTMAIFAIVSSEPFIEGFSASVEMFMLLPVVASLLLCISGSEKERYSLFFFSGLFSAAAFWIKQPALIFTFFLLIYIIASWMKQHHSVPVKGLVGFFTGFFLLSSIISFYFYQKDIMNELVYWSFIHSLAYASSASYFSAISYLLIQLRDMFFSNPGLWSIGLIALIIIVLKKIKNRWIVVGFLISSFIAAAHSPLMYRHYFALLCPAAALAGGFGCSYLNNTIKKNGKNMIVGTGTLILIIIILPILLNYNYYLTNTPEQTCRFLFPGSFFPESSSIGGYLQNHTTPDDKILILGSEPQILVYANRKSATRHLFFYHVVGPYKRAGDFQRQIFEDIYSNKPDWAVVNNNIRSWAPNVKKSIQFIRRLKYFLHENYEMVKVITSDSYSVSGKGEKSNKPSITVWHKKNNE